jgi:1-deoxy-D-xylulose-5-phosphate synthase
MLKTALHLNSPVLLRYPRGRGAGVPLDPEPVILESGRGRVLRRGKDLSILAAGNRVHPALRAAELLAERGIEAGVADMRFIKPLDEACVREMLEASGGRLLTVEDNALATGFGSAVLEFLNSAGLRAEVLRLGIPDQYVEHGRPEELYADLKIDSAGIAASAAGWLQKRRVAA